MMAQVIVSGRKKVLPHKLRGSEDWTRDLEPGLTKASKSTIKTPDTHILLDN